MLKKLVSHLTYANAIATIALVIGLGGGAYFALAAFAPGGAVAGTKTATVSVPDGQFGTATAKCGRGQRATGGGFLTTVIDAYESRKSGQGSWQTSAFNASGSPKPLTAYAYCKKGAPSTSEKSATMPIPVGSYEPLVQADAKCSGSKKARAGGFSAFNPASLTSAVIINSSRVGSKTWRSGAVSFGVASQITSYVYCAKGTAPKAKSATSVAPTQLSAATLPSAECKRGTKPLAGGFEQPGATYGITGAFFYAFSGSQASGKRWQMTAIDLSATPNNLKVTAYCG